MNMKNVFRNNYAMAIISIVLIVAIVAISLNFKPQPVDSTGQAYIQEVQDDVIRIESSPAMTRVYTESKPEGLAYLRDN